MDTPHPEEDDALMAMDPLDVVEHVLSAENLAFDRTEDGDLAFALTGDWKDYELWSTSGSGSATSRCGARTARWCSATR